MTLKHIFLVFLGGGIGSALRYLLSKSLYPLFSSPISGTFVVNIIGSLLIGLVIGLEIKNMIDKPLFLLLVTGFCGGFTTFSAFSLENYNLFKSGDYLQAFIYIFSSVILGLLAVGLGFLLARQV
jgi:CrcB protein